MTHPTPDLTATLLQLSEHAERIAVLDGREADHWRETGERLADLAQRLQGIQGRADDQAVVLGSLEGLDVTVGELERQLAELAGPNAPAKPYEPEPTVRWWSKDFTGEDRQAAMPRLRYWVNAVLQPCYGYLGRALGPCWEAHPVCLFTLDWLIEMWAISYTPEKRGRGIVGGQAEFTTRWLPQACNIFAEETSRCVHSRKKGNDLLRSVVNSPGLDGDND